MLLFLICIATVFITFAASVTYHLNLYKFIEPSGQESCDFQTTFYVSNGFDDPQINAMSVPSADIDACVNSCTNFDFEKQGNHNWCPTDTGGTLKLPWTFDLEQSQDLGK